MAAEFVDLAIARVRHMAGLIGALRSEGGAFDGSFEIAADMLTEYADLMTEIHERESVESLAKGSPAHGPDNLADRHD